MSNSGTPRNTGATVMGVKDTVVWLGSLSAAVVAIVAGAGMLLDWIPAKAADLEDVRQEVSRVKEEVASVKEEVATIGMAQQESLELQLMTRLDVIADQIGGTEDPLQLQSLRQSRTEIKQRLTRARNKIESYMDHE
jgi:hypothetical protein